MALEGEFAAPALGDRRTGVRSLSGGNFTELFVVLTHRRFSGSTPTGGFAFGASYIGQVAAAVPRAGGGSSSEPAASGAVRAGAIIPADLDGELSQQLQKLSKRDATTKLKALQVRRGPKPVQGQQPSGSPLVER